MFCAYTLLSPSRLFFLFIVFAAPCQFFGRDRFCLVIEKIDAATRRDHHQLVSIVEPVSVWKKSFSQLLEPLQAGLSDRGASMRQPMAGPQYAKSFQDIELQRNTFVEGKSSSHLEETPVGRSGVANLAICFARPLIVTVRVSPVTLPPSRTLRSF